MDIVAIVSVVVSGIVGFFVAYLGHHFAYKGAQESHKHRLKEIQSEFEQQRQKELECKRKDALLRVVSHYYIGIDTFESTFRRIIDQIERGSLNEQNIKTILQDHYHIREKVYEDSQYNALIRIEFTYYWRQYNEKIYNRVSNFINKFLSEQEPFLLFIGDIQKLNMDNTEYYRTQCTIFHNKIDEMKAELKEIVTEISTELNY